jgi:hypothetical protein
MKYIILNEAQAENVKGDYLGVHIVPYKLNSIEYILPIDLLDKVELRDLNLSQYPQREVSEGEFPKLSKN